MSRFWHPYQPYDIQEQFMEALYMCIDEGKIGLFESPTGTGKSLSLICGSLTWLREFKKNRLEKELTDSGESSDPDWMREAATKERRQALLRHKQELEQRLSRIRAREESQRKRDANLPRLKKPRLNETGPDQVDSEAMFELDDYDSDAGSWDRKESADDGSGLSAITRALLARLAPPAADKIEVADDEMKIIYASRTHSQLSQFVTELRRVKPPPSISHDDEFMVEIDEKLKHLSLGSRKNLCINPKVSSLGSATAITDKCLELQQPNVSSEHKCPFVPTREKETLVNDFRDYTLAAVRDIEDLCSLGKKMEICAYYASRAVIKPSEIITLPYPLLLQKSARESLNLSLQDHVVIIDEAHNLIDAICNVFSASVSLAQLQSASTSLMSYAQKFNNRLKGKNRMYVTQTIRLVNSVADALRHLQSPKQPQPETVMELSALTAGKGVDQINPHKLTLYLKESKLARKVEGYIRHTTQRSGQLRSTSTPILQHVQNFLAVLMNPAAEGRFFASSVDEDVHLRYTLLDPTSHFRDVVEEARAVVLAGGTMSPMSDYADHLFSYVPPERLTFHSFGHVIPPTNLCVATLGVCPSGLEFDFTFEKRSSERLILELGRSIQQLCQMIPDGLVVFFPSYDYLDKVLKIWKSSASGSTDLFQQLSKSKPVFYESREKQTPVADNVLQDYTVSVSAGKGGLLLSVVGGKLSEGINFADALGRGVVVVGLPFPNIHSAEWKAKLEHIEASTFQRLRSRNQRAAISDLKAKAKAAAREFYENSCIRAVNQCIGRAIRHRNDYAAIVLIDRRFGTKRIQDKLPGWIRQSMVPSSETDRINSTEKRIRDFFKDRESEK